jgi:putative ABC transport system permease protein
VKAGDLLRFASGALVGHRLRALLSVSGVAVGVAAVVSLTALGEGARRYVVNEFAALGSNLLIVIPGKVETTGAMPFGGVTHDLTLGDMEALALRIPAVRKAAPLAVANDNVQFGERGRFVPILGTTRDFMEVRKIGVGSGDFLPARDPEEGGNEMVLGLKAAKELFGPESPLGKRVKVGPWRFRVVGVLDPRGHSMGFDLDDVVFVPVKTLMRAFDRRSLFRILLEVRSREEMNAAKASVLRVMADRHRAEDVTVFTQDAVQSSLSSILATLTLALGGIASVSLAVAGVGIMNVMLVSVSERRSEVGLLKALGATDRQILSAFLAEAALLTTSGGLLGLGLGWAAVRLLTEVYPAFPAAPPEWAVASALGLSLVVGLGFGLWPAYRATRLDPVSALTRR